MKIVSDGTVAGTSVFNDAGEIITGITSISVYCDRATGITATLTIKDIKLDINEVKACYVKQGEIFDVPSLL
jgi:hypothetical protein